MSARRGGMIRTLWRLAGPLRRRLGWGVALRGLQGVALAAPTVVIIGALQHLIDRGDPSTGQIVGWSIVVLAAVLAQYVLGVASARLTWIGGYQLIAQLRVRTLAHLERVPMGDLSRRQTGDVTTVLTQDLQSIEPVAIEIGPQVFGAAIAPVIIIAVTCFVDWRLGLATLLTLVLTVPVHLYTQRRFAALARVRQRRQAEAVARILEYVEGVPVIRAYNQVCERMARFRDALDGYRATNLQLVHSLAPLLNAVRGTIEFGFAVVLLAAIYLFVGGQIGVLTVMAFLVLALRIYQPIVAIVMQAEALRIAEASLERVEEVLEIPPQPQPERARRPERHDIVFDHVRFAYDAGTPDEIQVLREVSLQVPERSLTGLVGPSGAGKSTIARLVAGFWEVDAGSILMGGIDIREIPSAALLDAITVVFQDSFLFHDTIAGNLRLGDPDASDEQIVAAARAARCHDFITALPDAYDTIVGDRGATCRAASASASASPVRCSRTPRWSSSTSRPPRSTPPTSGYCNKRWARWSPTRPCSSSPTAWPRSGTPTRSSSSTRAASSSGAATTNSWPAATATHVCGARSSRRTAGVSAR